MGAERRMMVGRGPDYLPRVMEVDTDGYLVGVGTLATHVPQFNGAIWYVQSDAPADGDGTTPGTPLATIIEAIAAAAAGDAITVGAGTYDGAIDLNKQALQLWCELGVIVTNVGGGALVTQSADYTLVRGLRAIQAGQVGFHITGGRCVLDNCRAGPGVATGYDIDGGSVLLRDCYAGQAMYVVYRPADRALHGFDGDFSAGSTRDFDRISWYAPKLVLPNGAMLMRMLNASDGLASSFEARAIYED